MIQRIQTLWLLLAVALSVAAFFFPLAIFTLPENLSDPVVYNLIPKTAADSTSFLQTSPAWVLLILNILVGILCLVDIFLYKNRKLQEKVLAFAFIFTAAYLVVLFLWQVDNGLEGIVNLYCKGKDTAAILKGTETVYGLASYCPIAQIVLLWFARTGIRNDEKLVRSSEHLR